MAGMEPENQNFSMEEHLKNSGVASVAWSEEHEIILVEWADKAMCYRWLHGKSHKKYTGMNTWFIVPVIIMSTLTGTANFAQEKLSGSAREMAPIVIGAVNIFAGILSTIHQFLKISELNESHKLSSVSWDKLFRNIKVELEKKREQRLPVMQMIKIYKDEYDRLMETSPIIRDDIIKAFITKFSGGKLPIDVNKYSEKQKHYLKIYKPEICGDMISTSEWVYKPSKTKKMIELTKGVGEKKKQVKLYIDNYNETHKRNPTLDETKGYFKTSLDESVITSFYNSIVNAADNPLNSVI